MHSLHCLHSRSQHTWRSSQVPSRVESRRRRVASRREARSNRHGPPAFTAAELLTMVGAGRRRLPSLPGSEQRAPRRGRSSTGSPARHQRALADGGPTSGDSCKQRGPLPPLPCEGDGEGLRGGSEGDRARRQPVLRSGGPPPTGRQDWAGLRLAPQARTCFCGGIRRRGEDITLSSLSSVSLEVIVRLLTA